MLVTAVGMDSEWGRTMALVAAEVPETPLQIALGTLAAAIGKVGLAVGALCFVVLMIRCGQTVFRSTSLKLFHCRRRQSPPSLSQAAWGSEGSTSSRCMQSI